MSEKILGKRVCYQGEWGIIYDFQPRINTTRISILFDNGSLGDYSLIEACIELFNNVYELKFELANR